MYSLAVDSPRILRLPMRSLPCSQVLRISLSLPLWLSRKKAQACDSMPVSSKDSPLLGSVEPSLDP